MCAFAEALFFNFLTKEAPGSLYVFSASVLSPRNLGPFVGEWRCAARSGAGCVRVLTAADRLAAATQAQPQSGEIRVSMNVCICECEHI